MIDYNELVFAILITSFVQISLYFFVKFLSNRGIKSNYFAEQKIHEGEIPRVGGLLFLSSFFVTFIFIEINYLKLILPLLIGSLIIFLFSFYEDLKQSLSPYFRLIILFIGSFVFVFFSTLPNINVSILQLIKDYEILKILLFILSLMLLMNGFNFIDGLNGLSSFNFISIISSILYVGYTYNDDFIVKLSTFVIVFAIFIFLLNFPFGKIFLGDSGSYSLGALYSFFLIYEYTTFQNIVFADIILILALIPGVELVRLSIYRLLAGRNIFSGDLEHLHHLLINKFGQLKTNFIVSLMIIIPISLMTIVKTNLHFIFLTSLLFYFMIIHFLKK